MLALPEFEIETDEQVDDMGWATPLYSRRKVDVAGAHLAGNFRTLAEHYGIAHGANKEAFNQFITEVDSAYSIINNWRASHSYPLQIIKMALWRRAKGVDNNAIVAQRLKRLSSVSHKLQRNAHMKLSQMQDIGGCRAVLRTVGHVDHLVDVYEETVAKNPHGRPERIEEYDYIEEPKPDGYRSVHFVYKYRTLSQQHLAFDGLRIEVQLRSQLQHAWATAVETVSTFTGQALKSNIGDADWKRFFALMGSAIAAREKRPLVPGTPENNSELTDELRTLALQLRIEAVLSGWSTAIQVAGDWPKEAQVFLLILDSGRKTVQVKGFGKDEGLKADEEYLKVEKENTDNPDVQAVLVSVDSISALQSAYPNYYLDTSEFLAAVRLAID
jgi:ppGpp synthetase/RelA/SpoT-type nucleotidyltranferase